jgi:hypothetical protein
MLINRVLFTVWLGRKRISNQTRACWRYCIPERPHRYGLFKNRPSYCNTITNYIGEYATQPLKLIFVGKRDGRIGRCVRSTINQILTFFRRTLPRNRNIFVRTERTRFRTIIIIRFGKPLASITAPSGNSRSTRLHRTAVAVPLIIRDRNNNNNYNYYYYSNRINYIYARARCVPHAELAYIYQT